MAAAVVVVVVVVVVDDGEAVVVDLRLLEGVGMWLTGCRQSI